MPPTARSKHLNGAEFLIGTCCLNPRLQQATILVLSAGNPATSGSFCISSYFPALCATYLLLLLLLPNEVLLAALSNPGSHIASHNNAANNARAKKKKKPCRAALLNGSVQQEKAGCRLGLVYDSAAVHLDASAMGWPGKAGDPGGPRKSADKSPRDDEGAKLYDQRLWELRYVLLSLEKD